MIKIEVNKDGGYLEMRGKKKEVAYELTSVFEEIAEMHNDVFSAALSAYLEGRGDDND